ncbi:MAG: prolipoprotein diacylglyceryl transferase family protein [Acidimicrobiia bacterium]
MEFGLLFAAALAIAVAALVIGAATRDDPEERRSRIDLLLGAVMGGVLVGRITAMLLGGTNPLLRPADLLIVRGGVEPMAATLGALTAVIALRRQGALRSLDLLAVPALAGLAGWHGACLLRSACLGSPSELPWAYAESGSTLTRHPVELYAAVLFGVVALLLARAGIATLGALAGSALVAAAAIRLLTEPLRPTLGSGRVATYGVGLAVAALATVALSLAGRGRSSPSVHSDGP